MPAPPVLPPRVYLTGLPGSGKSTVGPLLADALGYRFVDLDWLVEARTGRPVAALFAEEGEAAFRAAEAEALAETTRGPRLVVSTGGGALVQPGAMDAARAAGLVVWLRVPPEVLALRLADAAARPLLRDADGRRLAPEALAARLRGLEQARAPHYARADLAVDAVAAPEAVASALLETLRARASR